MRHMESNVLLWPVSWKNRKNKNTVAWRSCATSSVDNETGFSLFEPLKIADSSRKGVQLCPEPLNQVFMPSHFITTALHYVAPHWSLWYNQQKPEVLFWVNIIHWLDFAHKYYYVIVTGRNNYSVLLEENMLIQQMSHRKGKWGPSYVTSDIWRWSGQTVAGKDPPHFDNCTSSPQ